MKRIIANPVSPIIARPRMRLMMVVVWTILMGLLVSVKPVLANTVGTSVTVAPCKLADITCNGVIDEYDFSVMLANWGKTGTNSSDLNHDHVVNEYDFSILMAKWGP